MTEKLFQFIWQFRYFNQHELLLNGEKLTIIYPGHPNPNQGPDFLNAKIKIGRTTWVGHVELHLKSSDWKKHAHENDRHYSNVMLHVVFEHDKRASKRNIPTLVLKQRISKLFLKNYRELMYSQSFIPCKKNISQVNDLVWVAWQQRLLVERLHRKSTIIQQYLHQNRGHWEETLWWMIAASFGMKVNANAFETVARSLPIQILAKHKNHIHQLEALLLGQAGLLEGEFCDAYPLRLQTEYRFLKNKYQLPEVSESIHFLRMRPVNFPTIRLSQLAALIHGSSHLFSRILEAKKVKEIKQLLSVTAHDYWHHHYIFTESSTYKKKTLGPQMIENIIINTIIPMLYTYGYMNKNEKYKNRALEWFEALPPEKNGIMEKWKEIQIAPADSSGSQALLELKSQYCDKKRCLECAVGNALLKNL